MHLSADDALHQEQDQEARSARPDALGAERWRDAGARLIAAIEWLSLYRDTITGPPVPAVKLKFDLSNMEAVEALKRGRALRNARAL